MGHAELSVSTIVPNPVLVQLLGHHSFSFGPGDQEALLLLVHLVHHANVVLEMCHGDLLFLVFCILHRLF